MQYKYTPAKLNEKYIDELSVEEMSFIHLNTSYSPISVKNGLLRSTLSFTYQNIQHALHNENSKHLMPYIALCSILDQLGICYNRKDKSQPSFQNGLKRCLVNFGELNEKDEMINVLYALRNGLLHNISLVSYDYTKKKYYRFRYSKDINSVYQNPQVDWDGNYTTLDNGGDNYTTLINVEKFKDLVYSCRDKAEELNQQSLLELRLPGGARQLFYDYIRGIKNKIC